MNSPWDQSSDVASRSYEQHRWSRDIADESLQHGRGVRSSSHRHASSRLAGRRCYTQVEYPLGLSARNLLILGVRFSFAWKESACSFPCGREFSGQYVGVVPAIELIGEIQFHAL